MEISQHLIRMTKWNPQTRIIYISGVVLQSTKDRQLITQLCKNQNQGHQQRITSDSEFAPIMSKSSIISSSEDSVIRMRKAYYHNRFVTDCEFKPETNCHQYLTSMGQPPRSQSQGVRRGLQLPWNFPTNNLLCTYCHIRQLRIGPSRFWINHNHFVRLAWQCQWLYASFVNTPVRVVRLLSIEKQTSIIIWRVMLDSTII